MIVFLGLLDPDPLYICTDPTPDPDPSINKHENEEKPWFLLCCDLWVWLIYDFLSLKNKHKNLKKIIIFG